MTGHLYIGENMTVDIVMARFLNISVICLCSYVLDMFFNALIYKLEPDSINLRLLRKNKFIFKCARSPDCIVLTLSLKYATKNENRFRRKTFISKIFTDRDFE